MGPTNALQFAGITSDTTLMEALLPEDKLTKCRTQFADFCSLKCVTLKELQSLIGLLNFACCVVIILPGHAFLRSLIGLTRGIRKSRQINQGMETRSRRLAGIFERVQ